MDWTLEDNMVDGFFVCATLTSRRGGHTPQTPFVQAGITLLSYKWGKYFSCTFPLLRKATNLFSAAAHHACSPTPTKISIDILLPGGGGILSITPFWPLHTIHTHLAYNVISAYLIVLVTVAL